MKQFIAIVLFSSLFFFNFALANDGFEKAMIDGFQKMSEAQDANGFLEAVNHFSRIANAEQDKWLAWYYTAYSYTIISFMEEESDKRDTYLEMAQEALDKATPLSKDNSELVVLQGFIYMAQTAVSPMIRGMLYGPKTSSTLDKAITLDPNNPRAYFLKGQNTYYTPSMFGGGAESAKPHFEKAAELFATKTTAAPSLLPNWGNDRNASFLKKYTEE